MRKKSYESEGLYRFQIIAPLLTGVFARGEQKKKLQEVSSKFYEHAERGWEKFAYKTIEEWYYNYRRYGMSGLEKNIRSDCGKSRSISSEIGELIIVMKKENPQRSVRQILKELILAGKIRPKEIRRSSVYRLLSQHKIEIQKYRKDTVEKRKYEFQFSNECWQSDVKHAGYFYLEGFRSKKKLYLFAFLDDASRIIPHGEFVLHENLENFLNILKTALMKKGVPQRLYLDNASYFRSPIVKIIGARIEMRVIYCSPYSPYKKGKIERFWRRCSEQFLSYLDRKKRYTIEYLNQLFMTWVEQDYHHSKHTTLNCSPIEAWQKKAQHIRYLELESLEKDFLHEKTRKIRKDGTLSLKGIFYEVSSFYSCDSIIVRYDPFNMDKVFVYLTDGTVIEAYPVNEVENQKSSRKQIQKAASAPSSGINFIDLLEKEGKNNV